MYYISVLYVTKYVHFNNEVFLELSNDENLLRKILLLTNGNFYEGSIDHINMNYLIKDTTLNPSQFEYLNNYCRKKDSANSTAARAGTSVIWQIFIFYW